MKRIWIKLFVELLDDDKIGPLPVWLKWRFVELLLVAAEGDGTGTLPPVTRLAWRLRTSEDDLVKSLRSLSEIGVVCESGDRWKVTSFEKRQAAMSTTERVQQFRERKRNEGETKSFKDDNEADVYDSTSSSTSVSLEEGEGTGEGETLRIPETMHEAVAHPDIRLFQIVTGGTLEKGHIIGGSFPGEKYYRPIVEVMQHLRKKHGQGLQEYLEPFWVAWSTRKTKDKKPYSKTNPTWLVEWAFQGEIPQANGHEPQGIFTPIPGVESTRKALEEKDQRDALIRQQQMERLAKGMKK